MVPRTRRSILTVLSGAALSGCSGLMDSGPPSKDELPEGCPTSLDLDIQWPREINTEPVGEFVTAYEQAYRLRNADSRLYSADYSANIKQEPIHIDDRYRVPITVSGTTRAPTMLMFAFEVNSNGVPITEETYIFEDIKLPDDPDYVPIEAVEDQRLRELLNAAIVEEAAVDESFTGSEMERYTELVTTLSSDASLMDDSGGREIAYFDVDGTGVLLVIRISHSIGDLPGAEVRYYVTEFVLRRTSSTDESPQNGELLECRLPE